jgi:guanyl-specific ribonuclease Sa
MKWGLKMRKFKTKKLLSFWITLALTMVILFTGCSNQFLNEVTRIVTENTNNNSISPDDNNTNNTINTTGIDESGRYSSKEEVAAYINTFDKLPSNYLKKQEAIALGWESNKGNLWEVTDEMSIGGDYFGNREKLLPIKDSRKWFECDINYEGGYRNSERILFSNDGLIFYTDDHYKTFTQLY